METNVLPLFVYTPRKQPSLAYNAHTLYADAQVEYIFYDKLNHKVSKLLKNDQLVIQGDFNGLLV